MDRPRSDLGASKFERLVRSVSFENPKHPALANIMSADEQNAIPEAEILKAVAHIFSRVGATELKKGLGESFNEVSDCGSMWDEPRFLLKLVARSNTGFHS